MAKPVTNRLPPSRIRMPLLHSMELLRRHTTAPPQWHLWVCLQPRTARRTSTTPHLRVWPLSHPLLLSTLLRSSPPLLLLAPAPAPQQVLCTTTLALLLERLQELSSLVCGFDLIINAHCLPYGIFTYCPINCTQMVSILRHRTHCCRRNTDTSSK